MSQPASGSLATAARHRLLDWLVPLLCLAIIGYFYAAVDLYGPNRGFSTIAWLYRSWNPATNYEHGFLVPVIMAGLIAAAWKKIHAAASPQPDWLGLGFVVIGGLLYVAAYRTFQARVAVGSLPFVLLGCCWFLWGARAARLLAFPLFFLFLAIPVPQLQQATIHLQLLAAWVAHHGGQLAGVDNYVQGTAVVSPTGQWDPLEISGGCSGIRSLMALVMITSAWAYVAPLALWKRAVLLLAAVPLAIIGNALRVTSIVIIAHYGDPAWASGTWHDWSGMLLFYPVSLLLLLVVHGLLDGGLPWRGMRRKRRTVVRAANHPEPANKP